MYAQVSLGMRFRMMFETEESGVRRYMGTVTGISDTDPVRWKNSQWRSLQVGWDESAAGERPSRVSIWEIEPVVTPFYMCPPPFFRQKFPQQPGMLLDDSELENAYKRGMTMPWLEDMQGTKDSIFPGLSLVQWMSMQQQNHAGFQPSLNSSLNFEDPSKLLSFQSPPQSNKLNQKNQPVTPLQQVSPPTSFNSSPMSHNQMGQQQTQLQHNLSQRQQSLLEQQQTLQMLQKLQQQHQHQFFSPTSHVEPLQHQVLSQIQQLKNQQQQQQLSSNSLSTSTLVQSPHFQSNQQQSQYKPIRVLPGITDGDPPSCSTSPSTNNCQVTPSNFLIKNQQPLSVLGDVQSQNRSDSRVKNELSNLKLPDQTKDKALATEPATSVTSYSLDAATGLPHNFSIPNFSLEGDGVHSQPRSDLPFGANLDSLPPDALLSRGQLEGMEWKLVYVDHENDILLVGDDPWEEFVSCVQSIKILSFSEVQKMSLDGDLGGMDNSNEVYKSCATSVLTFI
nr:auxin response factor 19 [Tanacetum cinerariifolium]